METLNSIMGIVFGIIVGVAGCWIAFKKGLFDKYIKRDKK